MSALTDLLDAAGRLRDSHLQQRIQLADSIDAGGADVAVQLMGTEPVLEQKEGPIRGAASSKQGNLQQTERRSEGGCCWAGSPCATDLHDRLSAAGAAHSCPETASSASAASFSDTLWQQAAATGTGCPRLQQTQQQEVSGCLPSPEAWKSNASRAWKCRFC